MITSSQLKSLEEAGFDIEGRESLVDITNISADTSPDKMERVLRYMYEVRNPYMFKVGNTPVRVKYSEGSTLQQAVTNLLKDNNA